MSVYARETGKTFRLVMGALIALSNGERSITVHKTIAERDIAHRMAVNALTDIECMKFIRKEVHNSSNGGFIVFTSLTEYANSLERARFNGIRCSVLRDADCWDFDDKRNLAYRRF